MYKLLIADDEHLERDAIELLIKQANLPLTCIKAKNGREAAELAKEHTPEIVFLDIRMPGLNGIEAARKIRAMNEHCHIVFLTAWSTFKLAQKAIRIGASEYLVKPVQRKEIYDLLDNLIAQLDALKLSEKQQAGEIRQVINLFSREFFASLKFSRLSPEAMRSYFQMEGITTEEGFALVISGCSEEQLRSIFLGSRFIPLLQVCYFPAIDRITLLIFTRQGTKIIEQIAGNSALHSFTTGSGLPFTNLEEIARAISSASIAHSHAKRQNIHFQRFSGVLLEASDYSELKVKNRNLIAHALAGEIEKARTLAHEILDNVQLRNSHEEASSDELYNFIMVIYYELNKNIPFLNFPKPQKESLIEQEYYLMDFLDYACEAVTEDRRDRYSRLFRYLDHYLHANLHLQLSIEEVASIANLNTKYFSQLCKHYLGAPFLKYVTSIRMERAKELLANSSYSIKEIAEMTGFSDSNYFSRVFRHTFDLSPSAFREERETEPTP